MNSPTQKLYNNYTNSAGKEIQVNVNYFDPPEYYIYDKSSESTGAILKTQLSFKELNKFLTENKYDLSTHNTENKLLKYKIINDLSKDKIENIDTNTGGRKSYRKRKSHRRRKSHKRRKSHRRRK